MQLNIKFIGDVGHLHELKTMSDLAVVKNFRSFFQRKTNSTDVFCWNLEGVIGGIAQDKIDKIGPYSHCDIRLAEAMSTLGKKNIANLANNHCYDFGYRGLEQTINCIGDFGTLPIGAITKKTSNAHQLLEIKGKKILFISFAEHEFNNNKTYGANLINYRSALSTINYFRDEVDFIIAQIHGGVEDVILPSPSFREFARFLVDIGSDLVVGHHSHMPGTYEKYKNKDIFYSLGNGLFLPHKKQGNSWNVGTILDVNIISGDTDAIRCCLTYYKFDATSQKVRELSFLHAENLKNNIEKHNKILLCESAYLKQFAELTSQLKSKYQFFLTLPFMFRGMGRMHSLFQTNISFGKIKLLKQNIIKCQSLRDVLISTGKSK